MLQDCHLSRPGHSKTGPDGSSRLQELFSPLQVGAATVPNRLMRSATGEGMADSEGRATQRIIPLYRTLASSGVGVIVTGLVSVTEKGKLNNTQLCGFKREHLPGLERISDTVHRAGPGRLLFQLHHRGNGGTINRKPYDPALDVNIMSEEAISATIDNFAQAARLTATAGADGIQVQGGSAHLINQFLSPAWNQRDDLWGGSVVNRTRILREIFLRIREVCGADFLQSVKLYLWDPAERGNTSRDTAEIVVELANSGVHLVELCAPGAKAAENLHALTELTTGRPELLEHSFALYFNGGLKDPQQMREVLEQDGVDGVSLCRAFINEPTFAARLRYGDSSPVDCALCFRCLRTIDDGGVRCAVQEERALDPIVS